MLAKFVISLIRFYRWAISPFIRPRCQFDPTCSRYAIHAIEYHGLLKGSWLTLRRLLKCHPYEKLGGSWGYDPVPSHSLNDNNPAQKALLKKTH